MSAARPARRGAGAGAARRRGAGAALLELASPLARALQRELSVVYVESTRSLVAAALPFTQVLPHSGLQWLPLQPGDVEQGFRAHEARLRAADRRASRCAMRCAGRCA